MKTTPLSTRYLLRESALILSLSFLLLVSSTQNGLLTPQILAATAAVLTALALVYLIFLRRERGPLHLPVLVFLAALYLTALTGVDPRRSLAEAWLVSIPFFLAMVVSALVRRGWPGELVLKCVLIVGAIIMALAWVDPILWYLRWLQASGSWIPTLSYRLPVPNFLGVILNLLLMVAAARWLAPGGARSIGPRIILGAYVLSDLALLYLSSSRGAWLGTAAGLAVLFFLALRAYRDAFRRVWDRLRANRLLLAGLVLILLALAALAGFLLLKQMDHPTHVAVKDSRGYLWGPAFKAFLESPILGRGLHTYAQLFWREHSSPPEMYFVYSHNIYLDLLSGAGLPGFAAFAWLIAALVRALWRRFRASAGLDQAGVIGVLAALAAFGVHGFFDSVHHTVPTCLWTLCVLVAAVLPGTGGAGDSRSSVFPHRQKRLQPLLRGCAMLFIALIPALSFLNLYLLTPLSAGVAAANAEDWPAAARSLDEAARRDPALALIPQQQGLAYAVLASQGGPVTPVDPAALDSAVAAFERAAALDPAWNVNYANLGALYRARGDLAAARDAFERAAALAPAWAVYPLNLGEVEELLGEPDLAGSAYAHALDLQPSLSASPFWEQTTLRRSIRASWDAAHPAAPDRTLPELEAALAADPDSITAGLALARAYLAADRPADADRVLRVAELTTILAETQRLELYSLQAQTALALGDPDRAAELQSLADQGYRNPGAFGPGTFGAGYYGPLVYRRPAMALELVPQLTLP